MVATKEMKKVNSQKIPSRIIMRAGLVGVAPLSFGKAVHKEEGSGESPDIWEENHWMERVHADADGELFIPPRALKELLYNIASYFADSIPGKGKKTYTQKFQRGIMVVEPLMLGVKKDSAEVIRERLYVPADGKKGGTRRVWRNFPTLRTWETNCEIIIFDRILCEHPEIVERYLREGGKFIGFLRFNPLHGGYYGRYEVTDVEMIPEY